MAEQEGRDPQYAYVEELQSTRDYIALKRDEANIVRETGQAYSKVEGGGPQYADIGEDRRSKDYLDLKRDEDRIARETGQVYSRVK